MSGFAGLKAEEQQQVNAGALDTPEGRAGDERLRIRECGAQPQDAREGVLERGFVVRVRPELAGPAAPIVKDVAYAMTSGTAQFSVSDTGLLAYRRARNPQRRRVVCVLVNPPPGLTPWQYVRECWR